MLVTRIFEQLKIGVGALTVKSHKFCALQYSGHGDKIIKEE